MSAIICIYCNKEYKTYSSRSNHYKKYHKSEVNKSQSNNIDTSLSGSIGSINSQYLDLPNSEPGNIETVDNKLSCKNCGKTFAFKQSKWKHEKTCNNNNLLINLQKENENLKKINGELKKEISNCVSQISEIKELINKNPRGRPKKDSNNVVNSNNITNSNNTNNIQNNYNIVHLGNENLTEVFTKDEKLSILNGRYMALNDLIQYTHFNDKYPQYKNFYISNHKSDTAHKYDRRLKRFILVDKDELIKELIDNRSYDISEFFEELGGELNEITREKTADLIKTLENDKKLKLEVFNLSDKNN